MPFCKFCCALTQKHFQGTKSCQNWFASPFEKGSTLTEDLGSKVFPFSIDPPQKGLGLQESSKVTKVVSLLKMENLLNVSSHLKQREP